MKKNQKVLCTVLVMCMFIGTMIGNASAANIDDPVIQPQYTGISSLQVSLDITSSGYAECYAFVRPNSGYSVDLTMELQQDGTAIKTWTDSNDVAFALEKGRYVASGHEYQVIVNADIRNSSGIIISTATAKSQIVDFK